MRLNATPLLPLVLLASATPQTTQEVESPRTTVSVGSSCAEADLAAGLKADLTADTGELQVVVAAGPNRFYNLPSAIRLINEVEANTSRHISLVLRLDEDEIPVPLTMENEVIDSTDDRWDFIVDHLDSGKLEVPIAELLDQIHGDVTRMVSVQSMGTSYTEVTDSISETAAGHLVFLAHNTPLQWRLELAAQNTVSAGCAPENLNSVQVLCHDGSTLPGDSDKELFSYMIDRMVSGYGGHDFVVDTSRGGHRWGRMMEKLGLSGSK